ncbi:hypothetical protein PQR05_29840 [Paraburkholderia sediminicola]|uniref:hypothetical protein n=1 Tax=Paraburkholderia sediminicola TaxID=458836 RepID=UPI0038BAB0B7
MKTKPFEPSETGTDEAREYLVRFMRDTVGNATFAEYVRTELAGDFAWTLANHLAAARGTVRPVDIPVTAIEAFHEVHELECTQPYDWTDGMLAKVRTALAAAMNATYALDREAVLQDRIRTLETKLKDAHCDVARYAKLKKRARLDTADDRTDGTWFIGHIDAFSTWQGNPYDHMTFDGAVDALEEPT